LASGVFTPREQFAGLNLQEVVCPAGYGGVVVGVEVDRGGRFGGHHSRRTGHIAGHGGGHIARGGSLGKEGQRNSNL
jgi:hypothetical protein